MLRIAQISSKDNYISVIPPPLVCVKLPFESNPIPYPKYSYLSASGLLVFFISIAPNKDFSKAMLELLIFAANL